MPSCTAVGWSVIVADFLGFLWVDDYFLAVPWVGLIVADFLAVPWVCLIVADFLAVPWVGYFHVVLPCWLLTLWFTSSGYGGLIWDFDISWSYSLVLSNVCSSGL